MYEFITRIGRSLPPVRRIIAERDRLRAERDSLHSERDRLHEERDRLRMRLGDGIPQLFPPGHFYSPIPNVGEVRDNEHLIWGTLPAQLPGIELNAPAQLSLLDEFVTYYGELPFRDTKTSGLRFFYGNDNYSYGDAIVLYSMIRHARPNRIVEVGSGYSSCVTLDTNELFFGGKIRTTFIEPFPQLLLSLLKPEDRGTINLIQRRLQDVPTAEFASLRQNDILFIDSTHVAKVHSDVNYIFAEILPVLSKGVYVHFHDVFYPFEYPKEWVYEGRSWNEDYILRSFLQYNSAYEIVFFNTFLGYFYAEEVGQKMPLCLKNMGGSLWLRRTS